MLTHGGPEDKQTSDHGIAHSRGTPLCAVIHLDHYSGRILVTFCCSPIPRHTHATRGYMLYKGNRDPGQRFQRASGACLVECIHGAYPPGVRAAPRAHPHVAPRSSTTLTSVWCTCS